MVNDRESRAGTLADSVIDRRALERRSEIPTSATEPVFAPSSGATSPQLNPKKVLVTGGCLLTILIGIWVASDFVSRRTAERAQVSRKQEQLERDLAIQQLQDTELKPLYDQINRDSFDDRLPSDTLVNWTKIIHSADCNPCAGMTAWEHEKLRIWINKSMVKTSKDLLETMQHEMCHVALLHWGTDDPKDPHGPAFQRCMTRFP